MSVNLNGIWAVGTGGPISPGGSGAANIALEPAYGYAFANGYNTTGGDGASTPNLQVTTAAEYVAALATAGAKKIELMNDISIDYGGGSASRKAVTSNTTVWSKTGQSLEGISHSIFGLSNNPVNLKFVNIRHWGVGYDQDAFQLNNTQANIHFDHCVMGARDDYWLDPPAEATPGDHDGCVDATNGGNVTFSNCKFDTYDKLMLLFADDGNAAAHKYTFYRCWFDRVRQRSPALVDAYGHLFNCYWNNSTGGNIFSLGYASQALIHQCVMEDCPKGGSISTTYIGESLMDSRYATDNLLLNGSILWEAGSVPNYGTFNPVYLASLPAGFIMDKSLVKAYCVANAGNKSFVLNSLGQPVRI